MRIHRHLVTCVCFSSWLLVGLGCSPDEAAPPSACAAPGGAPLTHSGSITADETWSASSPHLLTSDVTIASTATVTVEPCAELRLRKGVNFIVKGKLVAQGEATRPINLRRDNDAERFGSLWIQAPGSATLAHTTIAGGGYVTNISYGAAVLVEGTALPPDRPLAVDHVTVSDSGGYGIHLRRWAGFTAGSQDLTVTKAGQELSDHPFPIRISLNAASTVPTGTYSGNATDEIMLFSEAPHYKVEIDDTIRDRGVPYQMGWAGGFGLIEVDGAGSMATLTIEAGVTLKFHSTSSNVGGLYVGANQTTSPVGQLVAVGTAAKPILFTGEGASPSAGAWEGITFRGALATGNRLEHVRIDAAGAHGGASGYGCPPGGGATDGALRIFTEPGAAFLKSSTISRSSSHGVFRAWTGSEVDFTATNTFSQVAGCNQVLPAPPKGSCPTSPPCPK